jgi:uncharacterized membrane protein YgcG
MLRLAAVVLTLALVPYAFAQEVISAQSGLVHHIEGDVMMDGQFLHLSFAKFPIVPEGKSLATKQGKAEILLTPGVFLRMLDSSSIQMISGTLLNARVEVTSGSALVEVAEIAKENSVAVRMGDSDTALLKAGLYLFDANAKRIRVYDGRAQATLPDGLVLLGKGKELTLGSGLVPEKFDVKDFDALYAWSQERSELVARANLSAAGALKKNGYRMSASSWAWYPSWGMLTFMPRSGYLSCPWFGYAYYSPGSVWQYYQRYNGGYYSGGSSNSNSSWSGMSRGSVSDSGYSSGGSRAAVSSAPAASAPAHSAPSGGRGR